VDANAHGYIDTDDRMAVPGADHWLYAIWLLPSQGVGVISGLPEIVGVLGLAAVALLLIPVRVVTRAGAIALAAIALVAVPAAASVSVVARRFGPFDTPFEGARASAVAAPFIYNSGREVVPIGGFTGTIPEPSGAALLSMIRKGDFHIVIQSPTVTDPRLLAVAQRCFPFSSGAAAAPGAPRFAVYYCGRAPSF